MPSVLTFKCARTSSAVSSSSGVGCQIAAQDLDRHIALHRALVRPIDRAHGARTEPGLQGVSGDGLATRAQPRGARDERGIPLAQKTALPVYEITVSEGEVAVRLPGTEEESS